MALELEDVSQTHLASLCRPAASLPHPSLTVLRNSTCCGVIFSDERSSTPATVIDAYGGESSECQRVDNYVYSTEFMHDLKAY